MALYSAERDIQNDACINDKVTSVISDGEENSEDFLSHDSNLININRATTEELETIPGIGAAKAKAIINYRENNGNFKTIDEVQNVDGIGSKLYEEIKAYITT